MKQLPRLIHNASVSYLPTKFPVQYYGLPDGKVFLIFARFYNSGIGKSGVEYVFAQHKEFLFDYENNELFSANKTDKNVPLFSETIDKPNPKIKIYKIFKKINSFAEAREKLNDEASKLEKDKVIEIGNSLRIKNKKQTVSAKT